MAEKGIVYYRQLPYTRTVDPVEEDGDRYFIARIAEIPPLRIHGGSKEEALLKLDEIFDDMIESMIECGDEIPEPERWPGEEVVRDRRFRRRPAREAATVGREADQAKPTPTGEGRPWKVETETADATMAGAET